jgi:hypothetical protein
MTRKIVGQSDVAIADDMKACGQSNVKTRAKQRFKYFQATVGNPDGRLVSELTRKQADHGGSSLFGSIFS